MKKSTKKHTTRNTIIAILVLLFLLALFLFANQLSKVHFYKDPSTTGNTSPNLLNGGLFTKCGDTIYFANPYDQNMLYTMDSDLKHEKRIYKDNVSYLNVAGDYIFYTRRNDKKGASTDAILSLSTTGLYRLRTQGTNLGQLYNAPTQTVNLLGNQVYYQHYDQKEGLQLYRVDIDGKHDTLLADEGVSPTAIEADKIYYTGADTEHNIHVMNTDGSGASVVLQGNFTGLSIYQGTLYFMDMEKDYHLCCVKTDGSAFRELTSERVATYNISEDGATIYYQTDDGKNNGIHQMDAATGNSALLQAGNYNFFHVIDQYLFFEEFDGSAAYVMDTQTGEIKDFHPAVSKK